MSTTFRNTIQNLPKFTKPLLVVLVILFISSLIPQKRNSDFLIEEGYAWPYEDLIASFDYELSRPAAEIARAKKELLKDFYPYYEVNPEVAEKRKNRFTTRFREQVDLAKNESIYADLLQQPERYYRFGLDYIDRVYKTGIINLEENHRNQGADFKVNVYQDDVTTLRPVSGFYNKTKIEEWISDSLFNSGLQEAEFLIPFFQSDFPANVIYNEKMSRHFRESLLANLDSTAGIVQAGDLIVAKDSVVTPEIYSKLLSYRQIQKDRISNNASWWWRFTGHLLLTTLILGLFVYYLRTHFEKIYERFAKVIFMLGWIIVFSYLVYFVETTGTLSVYFIPFCIVPIVVKIFYEEQLAFYTHIVIVLIASYLSSEGYEFTFLQILAGLVVVVTPTEVRNWSSFFNSIMYLFLTYVLTYLGLNLIASGNLTDMDWSKYSWIILNVFLTLLAYPLIPLLERIFGFTSQVTLVELSDLGRPLLKDLAVKAPGTFQHSLQVGNLSEAAANKIGVDALLLKVGALYHDIGKMDKADYFIENQSGQNPHDELNSLESAKVIIEHVANGVKLAQKHKLPTSIIDFIKTHHGSTRVEYFYRNYIKENPMAAIKEGDFRYPGPKPSTKEETILMIADSLEAAAKSLKEPTETSINKLVEKIVATKIGHGQLEHSDLTFEELEICVEAFKATLKSIHHVRIEYPS